MPGEEGKWLPVGDPPGKPRERSLNLNNTIFTVTAPRYAYMQNLSQIRDVACSTYCMVLHGFLMDSLLSIFRKLDSLITLESSSPF